MFTALRRLGNLANGARIEVEGAGKPGTPSRSVDNSTALLDQLRECLH